MFETHLLNDQGINEVTEFKSNLVKSIEEASKLIPEGREKSIFKTKMEEAVFFGTKGIASKEGNYKEIIIYEKK